MPNVFIQCDDLFFRSGFLLLLQEVFPTGIAETPAVAGADIIILHLCRGEAFICHPGLLHRRQGLLIGLVDNEKQIITTSLPLCLRNILFIQRTEAIHRIITKIKFAWLSTLESEQNARKITCQGCPHRTFSPQQQKIAIALAAGLSLNAIASSLSLGYKTVFTHKKMIMDKFFLRNDVDLLLLLRRMQRHECNRNDSADEGVHTSAS
ncbi:helix-turn-helix transcriptional regulator [Trabulsiella odontotermitis]|uniref:helix-turn-helix transcriptional regulator n=1 Tax=Trabulsiella odontotermitis TaxID=379893 RepID=UPI0006765AF2|nr:LuxR C-terminal-related transcriptional regulator [Trabulsiella odontotermitis]